MLKKRILASSMASVMALSAVSVVAFADETATSDIKTEVVTLAQLKEYVKSFEKFVEDELEDYGTIQEGWFTDALDAAQAAIDSRFSTEEDITAAYQMLKAVNNKLAMYTQDDLKALIDECKTDYDSENKYNKNFGDEIWGAAGWEEFVDAYEHAEDYLDSEDPADLNDAYLGLETAHDALAPKKFVSKSDFRKAFDEYSKIAGEFSNYEDWVRGTVSVSPSTNTYKDARKNKVNLTSASFITFKEIKDIVYGTSYAPIWVDSDQGRSRIGEPNEGSKWIGWGSKVGDENVYSVNDFVETAYDYFLDNADSTVTTQADIVKAYDVAVDAVKVFKSWVPKVVKGSSERVENQILENYRTDFISAGYADAFIASLNAGTFLEYDTEKGTLKVIEDQEEAAGALLINTKTGTFAYTDEDVYATGGTGTVDLGKSGKVETLAKYLGKNPAKGTDLMRYVPMTRTMVLAGAVADSEAAADAVAAVTGTGYVAVAAAIKAVESGNDTYTALTSKVESNEAEDMTAFNQAADAVAELETALTGAMTAAALADVDPYKAAYDAKKAKPVASDSKVTAANVSDASDYVDSVKNLAAKAKATLEAKGYYDGVAVIDELIGENAAANLVKAAPVNAALKTSTDEAALWKALTDAAVKDGPDGAFDTAVANIKAYVENANTGLQKLMADNGFVAANYPDYKAAADAFNNATEPDATTNVSEQNVTDAGKYLTAAKKVVEEVRNIVVPIVENAENVTANQADWFAELATSMTVFGKVKAEDAKEKKDDKDFTSAVEDINDTKSVGKAETKDAFALLIQHTSFALDNCFPGSAASKKLTEITDICDKAAELIEKTGDVSFDPLKTENANLAVARQMAIEWVGIAKNDSTYKDGDKRNNKKMEYDNDVDANYVYDSVNSLYNDLNADLAEFKYSYSDIAETIAEVAAGLDAGIYGTSAAAIKTAAEDVAFTLSTFTEAADEGNFVYDDDRNFLGANRLRTKTGRESQTAAEGKFTKKYEALLAAVEAATAEPEKPEIVMGDIDGVPGITPADANFALELFLNDEYIEAADMNHDGIITAADAYLILEAWLEA